MRNLIGQATPVKAVEFLGKPNAVEVRKLSGAEVKAFQAFIKKAAAKLPPEDQGLAMQNYVIRAGVVGAQDMTDEELDSFPYDENAKLAKAVLVFTGIQVDEAQGNAKEG